MHISVRVILVVENPIVISNNRAVLLLEFMAKCNVDQPCTFISFHTNNMFLSSKENIVIQFRNVALKCVRGFILNPKNVGI